MKMKYKSSNKKKVLMISIVLLLLTAFGTLSYSYIREDSINLSATGKVIAEVSSDFYNSVAKIIGFAVDETTLEPEPELSGEVQEETAEETIPEPEIVEGPEQTQELEEPIVEEQPAEEQQTIEQPANETIVPEENIMEEQTNITTPEIIANKTIENILGVNETLTNSTIENITEETNITIPEIIEEANITIVNETIEEINETIINETLVNETAITGNMTAFNITTKQYKAVINRKVKWIKTFKVDKTEAGNLTLDIPKQATNITVRTGEEVQEALSEIENYEQIIEQADRKEIAEKSIEEGTITGMVSYDIEESKGILTRFIEWLNKLTITGEVIQENELQEEITEKQDTKEIDLTNIIEQAGEQDEIGVEYYTPAPISEEKIISRGKQVIVSGPDELNYTDVLAYTILDNKISINNSEKIKLYWIREETEEQLAEEIMPAQEEIEEVNITITNETTEEINESIEETTNGTAEITENNTEIEAVTNETIINEPIEETTNETAEPTITALAIEELSNENTSSAELDNFTNIEEVEELEVSQTQKSITRTTREEVNFTAYDLDEDGMIDYIEWEVPHLSNQTYEIIYITKAEHLDENYTFVEDVYEQVKALDENWTLIPDGDYIRVAFEKPLDKTKDITIYARVKDACSASENENNFIMINGTEVPCDIYQKKKRIDEIRRLLGE